MLHENHHQIVLIIVAHTDDETLGLGGTIAKHVEGGDIVYAISMTNGVGSRDDSNNASIQLRSASSLDAGKILNFTWLDGGCFPDNSMDSVPLISIVKVIEGIKSLIHPTIIYTHSQADLNIDHQMVGRATLIAFRPQPNEVWQEIRVFEVPSSTDFGHKSITGGFHPNLYIDISKTWSKKLAALKAYKSEMRDEPHSRSYAGVENLAKYRGCQAGIQFAEAFEIIRKIER